MTIKIIYILLQNALKTASYLNIDHYLLYSYLFGLKMYRSHCEIQWQIGVESSIS